MNWVVPSLIMGLGDQKKLCKCIPCHADGNMVFRFLTEPGYDKPFGILVAGAAGCGKQKVELLRSTQSGDSGQAFAIWSGFPILKQFFRRGAAKPFLNGPIVTGLFAFLPEIPKLPAG